ncbi:Zinc finger C2H2-type [Salvia divinorum]|uniref:Zinc finger C2H2-type n=1 Tax=Salvia divinorum TaxID=28513 RepID=A0ABD1GZQ8_SALDI
METHISHSLFDRRPMSRSRAPGVKWFKECTQKYGCYTQDTVSNGGKWVNEATLRAMKERSKEPEAVDPEIEPTTEVLFLCSYEGCGKTFIDAGALRKHSHIHGERRYVCHYENCWKKFLDSSKLKRHFLIHIGRETLCVHMKVVLRSHMKTYAQENYHICPYPDCGKQYPHEYKLKNHAVSHHVKANVMETPKYVMPPEKPMKTPKSTIGATTLHHQTDHMPIHMKGV